MAKVAPQSVSRVVSHGACSHFACSVGPLMEIAGLYIWAYLVGSIPTSYLAGKLARGIDIREYGSGNLGISNVAHQLGRRWLVPVGIIDVLVKGASPVLIGHYLIGLNHNSDDQQSVVSGSCLFKASVQFGLE